MTTHLPPAVLDVLRPVVAAVAEATDAYNRLQAAPLPPVRLDPLVALRCQLYEEGARLGRHLGRAT